MPGSNEELAEQFADRFVGTEWRDDDGRIGTIKRVNSKHPDLEVGVFVDYEMSPDAEWITPVEMQERIENDDWEMWGEN